MRIYNKCLGDTLNTNLEQIKSTSQRLLSSWNDLIGEFESTQTDMSQPVIQIGKSLKDISEIVVTRLGFCSSIAAKDKKAELLIHSSYFSSTLTHPTSHFPIHVPPWIYPSQSRFLGLKMVTYLNNHPIDTEVLGQYSITLPNGVLLTPKTNPDESSGSFLAGEGTEFSMLLSLISSHLETYEPT
jgi:hypothetical protein